jgi:hypothetical protein
MVYILYGGYLQKNPEDACELKINWMKTDFISEASAAFS